LQYESEDGERGGALRKNSAMPRLRLADLLAGLSIATDLGFGLPPESAMRSCLAAARLARLHGLSDDEVRDSFYTSLLLHVGCPGFSHETASLFGNELAVTRAVARTNLGDPRDWETTLIPEAARGISPEARDRLAERMVEEGEEFGQRYDTASCEVASSIARRLGLGAGIERALFEIGEWWNGEGAPNGLEEEAISAACRVARVAGDAAVLDDLGGPALAVDRLRERAGSVLDPYVVATFAAMQTRFWRWTETRETSCSSSSPSRPSSGSATTSGPLPRRSARSPT
jgi:hypothetical protein